MYGLAGPGCSGKTLSLVVGAFLQPDWAGRARWHLIQGFWKSMLGLRSSSFLLMADALEARLRADPRLLPPSGIQSFGDGAHFWSLRKLVLAGA